MQSLILSIGIVFPTIAIMMLGWFLNRLGCFTESFIKKGTWFSYHVAMSTSIFLSLYGKDLNTVFNAKLLLYMMLGLVVAFVLLTLTVPRIVKDRSKSASMTHNMLRANFSVQGLPMLSKTYGAENVAIGSVILPFMVVINNVLGTLVYVTQIPDKDGHAVLNGAKKLVKNPLIIGSLCGMVAAATGLRLPGPIVDTMKQLAAVGTPLILICLGAEIDFKSIRRNLRYTIPTTLVRLVVMPGLLTLGGVLLGFRGIELGTIYLFNASCSVVSGYVMAAAMGGDTAIAAESLGLTALCSSVTVTLGLAVLLHLGLI